MWGSRVLVCCVLAGCAGDNRLDPSALELRDILGIAPETALTWDAGQRAAARHVIDDALHAKPATIHATGANLQTGLAVADADRDRNHLAALGVVQVALSPAALDATAKASSLAPHVATSTQIQLAGWTKWPALPTRGLDVLTSIAHDAGYRGGVLTVVAAPQLAVVASYVPAKAQLVVNPVLLAALEPGESTAAPPVVIAAIGNPYSFYDSIEQCASAQQARCEACLPNTSCESTTGTGDGNAECKGFAGEQGRGYWLVCIQSALEIQSVKTCVEANAPACPTDNTTVFIDDPACTSAIDHCLGDHGGDAPNPPTSSPDCSACEASPSCEDSVGCASDCSDSGGGGDCSSSDSSGDSCDSGGGDSSCDGGGCDGGDSGGDCSGGGGDDCSGGGGDCAGDSGGDCSGGGGGDCNAGGRHHDHGYLWVLLPLPFAIVARRRADRRRVS